MQTAQCPAQYHSRESLVTEIVNKKKTQVYIFRKNMDELRNLLMTYVKENKYF